MKNAIKYTAAMLLVSAGLNAYAAPKISVSGKAKVDMNSTKTAAEGEWSGLNATAKNAEISLNITTEQFDVKVTLDAAEWYNRALYENGNAPMNTSNPKDLKRLLDEAHITFKAAGGELTLGKQHIILVPKMETSSLQESNRKEQVIGIRFTTEAKQLLGGIGVDISLYETEGYDNQIGDENGFNIILSKDVNEKLTVILALQSDEDSASDDRKNKFTARGVYSINPKLNVSAEYESSDFNNEGEDAESSFKFGGEYRLSPSLIMGSSFKSYDKNVAATADAAAQEDASHTEFKAYGVKHINADTSVELYWSNKEIEDSKEDDDSDSTIGVRVDVKF